jgi:putative FmdB family regulatory protein
MPIYEYHCGQCEKDFELLVRGSTPIECPDCGSRQLRKKLSAFAISSGAPARETEFCGTCGMTPGACGLDD